MLLYSNYGRTNILCRSYHLFLLTAKYGLALNTINQNDNLGYLCFKYKDFYHWRRQDIKS